MRTGQALQHWLVAFQHALQATGEQSHGRPAASLFIVNLRTVHLCSGRGFSFFIAVGDLQQDVGTRGSLAGLLGGHTVAGATIASGPT